MRSFFHTFRRSLTLVLSLAIVFSCLLSFSGCGEKQQAATDFLSEGYSLVHFIDVGQGDCTLIESNDGKFGLIDASTGDEGAVIVEYLKGRNVKELDFVVFTHPHEDHIGGGAEVLQNFPADTIYMTSEVQNTLCYNNLIDTIKKRKKNGTKVIEPKNGQQFMLSDMCFTVISDGKGYDDLNDTSICLKLDYKNNSFIFTGDAEKPVEDDILYRNIDIDADVFKCAHHGSSTSNTEPFLDAISPKICVISCGKDNSYGHPHREIRDTLDRRNVEYRRTDLDGTVIVAFDGDKLILK